MPKKTTKPEVYGAERVARDVNHLLFKQEFKIPGGRQSNSLKKSRKHKITHLPAQGGFPARYHVHFTDDGQSEELYIESDAVLICRYAE